MKRLFGPWQGTSPIFQRIPPDLTGSHAAPLPSRTNLYLTLGKEERAGSVVQTNDHSSVLCEMLLYA